MRFAFQFVCFFATVISLAMDVRMDIDLAEASAENHNGYARRSYAILLAHADRCGKFRAAFAEFNAKYVSNISVTTTCET